MLMQNHAFSSPDDCRRFAEKILLFAYQRLHQQEGGRYDELIQQIKEYIRTKRPEKHPPGHDCRSFLLQPQLPEPYL